MIVRTRIGVWPDRVVSTDGVVQLRAVRSSLIVSPA